MSGQYARAEELLARLQAPDPPPFALLHRPESGGLVEILIGDLETVERIEELPLPAATGPAGPDVLALVPYRQIRERGFDAVDDGTPLVTLRVRERATVPLGRLPQLIADVPIAVRGGGFDADDEEYATTVRDVLDNEIRTGQGANFVVKRTYRTRIAGYSPATALALFRRLLAREQGAYWTFVVHTPRCTLVGASPERHLTVADGLAVMNPISGTYRYPAEGPALSGVLDFLGTAKETDELAMVLDEELKMMARICAGGCWVTGPYLKEMMALAHTEYLIEGRTDVDVREALRETLFAPTVTGSPVESASRVICRYEPAGRAYYSGVLAVFGRDGAGGRTLDSTIMIRTAEIDPAGQVEISVGSTLVRHSDPRSEAAETRAKAAGLLGALAAEPATSFGGDPRVRAALAGRNSAMADFWLSDDADFRHAVPDLAGRTALVIDAEDTFTWMLRRQLAALGMAVTVRRYDQPYELEGHELVVAGPGPGDPRDRNHPKIARLRQTIEDLLRDRRPFLAVCLSHQVLCDVLGLPLTPLPVPNQGLQREIVLFDRPVRVGFYNSFAARSTTDRLCTTRTVGPVEVSRSADGEVHALRGPGFGSLQFHAESVLTQDGIGILRELLRSVLPADTRQAVP